MITIIGAIVGLLGSFLPGLLNYLTSNANNSYQLELVRLQMQAAAQNIQLQIDLAQNQADIQQQQSLYSYDAGDAGPFINALRGSVRPVITYVLFLIWFNIELIGLFYGIHTGKAVTELLPLVWDNNMSAIFMTVIGFWFGGRMLEKFAIFPAINQPKTQVITSSGKKMSMSNASLPHNEEKDQIDGQKN